MTDHEHIAEEMAVQPDEVATLLVLDHPLARVYRAITQSRTSIFIIDKAGWDGPLGACYEQGCASNPNNDPQFALQCRVGFVAAQNALLAVDDEVTSTA